MSDVTRAPAPVRWVICGYCRRTFRTRSAQWKYCCDFCREMAARRRRRQAAKASAVTQGAPS